MDAQAGSLDPGESVCFSTYLDGANYRVIKVREDRWRLEVDHGAELYRHACATFAEIWDQMMQYQRAWRQPSPKKQDWSPRDARN